MDTVIGLAFFPGLVVLGTTIGLVDNMVQNRKQKKREAIKEAQRKEEFEREREKLVAEYGGKTEAELSGAPLGCVVGNDRLPRNLSSAIHWGDSFTFYITRSGNAYHRKCGCCGAQIAVNAYTLKYGGMGKRACSICKPELPEMQWVTKWLRVEMNKKKYGIK